MTSIFICSYVKTLENIKCVLSDTYAQVTSIGTSCGKLIPLSRLMLLTIRCGVLFCLKYDLSSSHSEGSNVWRNFRGYLKSWLYLHLLWQIVCPTCWGLVSYTSKSEHPADLIPNPIWALQNDNSQTEDYRIYYWNKLCLWGAGRHALRKLTGVSQHICGRTDEKQFSVRCLFCCDQSRTLSHLWMNWN